MNLVTMTFPVHDPTEEEICEIQLSACTWCAAPVGDYHLAGCIYGGYVDPLDCQKVIDGYF
jgi:hypothetical protein